MKSTHSWGQPVILHPVKTRGSGTEYTVADIKEVGRAKTPMGCEDQSSDCA